MSKNKRNYKKQSKVFNKWSVFIFISVFLICCIYILKQNDFNVMISRSSAEGNSFTFTAVGDYGQTDPVWDIGTDSVLRGIASSGTSFNLGLGDFAYGEPGSEQGWCNFVRSYIGPTMPFQIIAGNHDVGLESNYDAYVACMPNMLSGVVGNYGKEYYFDYQDISRFIMISPQIAFSEGMYSYLPGTNHYKWVSDAIDDARAKGIKWIIIGMHKHCMSVGIHECDVEPELVKLFMEKKVDLVLQAHDHTYQRSKQLAISSGCVLILPDSYNPNCVVDDGSDNEYIKGRGTVTVIQGGGGSGIYDVSATDPEAGYFSTFVGGENSNNYGFVKYTVTESRLTGTFIPTLGSTYSDTFSIIESVPVTTTPTLSPTPVVKQLNLTPVADSYVRSDAKGSNYGKWLSLRSDKNPIIISFMRFNLNALSGKNISSAKLRIRVMKSTDLADSFSAGTHSIKAVSNVTWGENSINYNNKPALGSVVKTFKGTASNQVVEVDLLSIVNQKKGGLMSLGIDTASTDMLGVYSKDSPYAPTLVVSYY